MARKRHRKSINPFRIRLDVQRPDWSSMLDPDKPVEVDLGFGRGEFILEMARNRPEVEFVGLEIRQYLIEKVRARLKEDPRANVHVLTANVKQHLSTLFDPGMLSRVYVHFPDPWTQRKRHHKRRMVDADLVSTLHTLLRPRGEVHLMTDKSDVSTEMLALFEGHGGFENVCGAGQFCLGSTTGVHTREEMYYIGRGDPVFRLRFVRKADGED
jgi:tRNA (guanine-N7-)-methyltransferase